MHDEKLLRRHITFTEPDYVMYVPRYKDYESDNVHLHVVDHPQFGGLIAFWTQSTVEGAGDNHAMMTRSRDGGKTIGQNVGLGIMDGLAAVKARVELSAKTLGASVYAGVMAGLRGNLAGLGGPTITLPSLYSGGAGLFGRDSGLSNDSARNYSNANTLYIDKYYQRSDADIAALQAQLNTMNAQALAGFGWR
jgi:hypothetical protein